MRNIIFGKMVFIKKLHKYVLGLALIASLVFFSGYANYIPFQVNNTEWVVVENSSSSGTTHLYTKFTKASKPSLKNFYGFNFDCFLTIQQVTYNLNFKVAKKLKLQLKDSTPYYKLVATELSNKTDDSYSDFIG